MMRFAVRAALGLIVTLATSSLASAQPLPVSGAKPNSRDPLLSRPFQSLTFDGTKAMSTGSISRPINATDVLLAPYGGRLPEVTAAPDPHGVGVAVPCTMRVVRVNPDFTSNMPVVSVDEKIDPKSVIKVICLPKE